MNRWIVGLAIACAGSDEVYGPCEEHDKQDCLADRMCEPIRGASADCGPFNGYAGCREAAEQCDNDIVHTLATDPDGLCWELDGSCLPAGFTAGCTGHPTFCD